ncbi:hypothetical protein M0R04_16480 [Candidatus Dojkabacteria bacterium]|jgi:hypothetical protein|nr:hypothetical protein [Candidatus Dojkabacteria bacterium]
MNIDAIYGFNKAVADGETARNILLAVTGNDLVNVDTGLGYGQNITGLYHSFETYLNMVFYQNYGNNPKTFDGVSWSDTNVGRTPISRWQLKFREKMYLFYCAFHTPGTPTNGGPFPSRVFYSDLPSNNKLTWGLEWGTNLTTKADDPTVKIGNSVQDFISTGIKKGDPFYITSGLTSGVTEFFVQSVDSRYQITLTENVKETIAGTGHYWTGSNWFDVGTDDNDYLMGAAENDDVMLIYKRFSLWRYNVSSKARVKGAPGTTSRLSIINLGDYTYHFHGSNQNNRKTGFYIWNGSRCFLASRAIQPYIDKILTSNYDDVVAWREGTKMRAWVGDLTGTPVGDITNAVITHDTEGNQWSVDPIADIVKSSGRFIDSNTEKWFIGNDSSKVMEVSSGYTHNGIPIEWSFIKGPFYPSGTSIVNTFTRIAIVSEGGRAIQVKFKLIGKPEDDDDQWTSLGDIQHNYQELKIPTAAKARGINLKFTDNNSNINSFSIKKIIVFCVPEYTRNTI